MSDPIETGTEDPSLEQDSRFPSGNWVGFFLQPTLAGKHPMELILTFRAGKISGEGRDRIGSFRMRGRYDVQDGRCSWTKTYIGRHSLSYSGYNEGRGIWGMWEMNPAWKGGFRIWPEAMGDPTIERLAEEVDEPAPWSFADETADEPCVTVGR